ALMLPLLAACAPADPPTPAEPPAVVKTELLGAFAGVGATLHPDNAAPHRVEFYGTDLGFTYQHDDRIQILFGDSWAIENYAPIEASTGPKFDDAFGTIDLNEWADPSRIAPGTIPPILLGQNPGTTEAAAIDPGHVMDLGKTPMGGFSNGSREFGIFNVGKPQGCTTNSDCSNGLTCDTALGYLGVPYSKQDNLTLGCRDGAPGCTADTMADAAGAPVPGSGFCMDPTSVLRGERISNLLGPVAIGVLVGLRDTAAPKKYGETRKWLTNKFMNVTVRTVASFDPAGKTKPDWSPATGEGSMRRVFLWGRPGFVGVAANQRSLALYFAYVDMPAGPGFEWKPMYYSGSKDDVPQFSAEEADAVPVDLDSTLAGVQPEEAIDIVNQMSVSWVEPLKKWVMFYGGGLTTLPSPALPNCGVLELFSGIECKDVVVGNGAVRMRSAEHPWGPWTPPQDVVVGDPAGGPNGQLGAGGALRHVDCKDPACAPHSAIFVYHEDEYGFFYSANIIEQWTRASGDGVDILWNASTWDPYRVVLFRTHIRQ
ncbi:MAG: hypothetical protein M3O07_00950, partial [Pseudomonadota bacterium]|nr:hypothetical protein [Pseudomonadota bacterium]